MILSILEPVVRLRLTASGVLGHLPQSRRAELEPLLTWDLPAESPADQSTDSE